MLISNAFIVLITEKTKTLMNFFFNFTSKIIMKYKNKTYNGDEKMMLNKICCRSDVELNLKNSLCYEK
jgi:hypothetical protein